MCVLFFATRTISCDFILQKQIYKVKERPQIPLPHTANTAKKAQCRKFICAVLFEFDQRFISL
ncbi:hypothetical protein HMPREF1141_0194 [Clostridium sp. MSTE9]|nr:hypothetical protein HMPREF1141_0194 [Clostridium sp. MSTE9]